jgi:S-formylglutathione hydrolase FrmB
MRVRSTVHLVAFTLAALAARSASSGEMRTDELDSKALAKKVKLNVLLPDGYDADPARRFPVVYLLHGIGGDHTEWQRVGVEKETAGLPVIIAMPEGDQSFYVNHHGDPANRWEDYIAEEVVGHVDAKYRTIASRKGRGISGLSMGGYGAVVVGLRKPELFGSIASHSGAVGILASAPRGEIAERVKKIFGPEGSEERKKYDPVALLKAVPAASRPPIYIDCGGQDFLIESNRAFVRELAAARAEYEYREVPGGHDFAYWRANIRLSLGRQLEALARAKDLPKADAVASAPGAPKPSSGSIDGNWKLLVNFGDEDRDYTLKLKTTGDKIEAVLVSPRSGEHKFETATFKDGKLHLEIVRDVGGQNVRFKYDGELGDKGFTGKVLPEGFEDQFQGTWKAERETDATKL